MKYLPLLAVALIFAACQSTNPNTEPVLETANLQPVPAAKDFNQYWYAGKAEINRFELEQARYGEVHDGQAVLVFVTEPFLTDKQVKADRSDAPNSVSVMKLNHIRKFPTGIYDYSTMVSSFTPVDRQAMKHSYKISCTSQEWCGHTFSQLNLQGNQYNHTIRSYFESEGDQEHAVDAALLEDELLSVIRLGPEHLPTGKIKAVPSLLFSRLKHRALKAEQATASLQAYAGSDFPGSNLQEYKLAYDNHTVAIYFEADFPYQIAGWMETYQSGWGSGARELSTKAIRTHSIRSDYWNKNSLSDVSLRKELGL